MTQQGHGLDIRFARPPGSTVSARGVQAWCRCGGWSSIPWRPEHPGHLEAAKDAYHEHLRLAGEAVS